MEVFQYLKTYCELSPQFYNEVELLMEIGSENLDKQMLFDWRRRISKFFNKDLKRLIKFNKRRIRKANKEELQALKIELQALKHLAKHDMEAVNKQPLANDKVDNTSALVAVNDSKSITLTNEETKSVLCQTKD